MKTFLRCLILAAALCAGVGATAQTLEDYTFSTGVDATKWVTITDSTNLLVNGTGDNKLSTLQDIGFRFPFAGTVYTQFSVNSDGNLRLGSTLTGTGSYSTPFSSSNANTNSPKINFFGCDGYYLDSIHYVYAEPMVVDGDSMLVVEFRVGTYNSTTRTKKYHWQVHLYSSGKIEAVYSAVAPEQAPNVSNQKGLCVNSGDGWVIDATGVATHFSAGSTTTWSSGTWPAPSTYYSFEIPDNICLTPSGIRLNSITSTTASLTILSHGDATSWLGTITPGIMGYSQVVFSDTNVNLMMLTPSTDYTVSVRAICGVGDTSNAATITFQTPCAPTSVPYTMDFDEETTSTTAATGVMPPCWTIGAEDVSMTAAQRPQIYYGSSNANSGSYSLRMYYRGYVALPTFNEPVANLQLDFTVRQTAASYHLEVGVMDNPFDASTFVPIDTIVNTGTSSHEEHTVYFYDYVGAGQYIAFHNITTSSYSYSYNYIDDVEVTVAPTCRLPMDIAATNVIHNAATIVWNGNGTSYLVEYGTTPSLTTATVVSSNQISLTGLMPTTQYYVRVRTLCGTDTSEAAMVSFTTTCAPMAVPYVMDFDEETTSTTSATGVMPSCWTIGAKDVAMTASQEPQVYYSSSNANSGSYSLRLYYRGYVAMPKFATPVDSLMMTFWVKQTSSSYRLVVGVMTDPMNAGTFVPVDTIVNNGTSTQEYHELFFNNYTGPDGYIAFHNITTNTYSYSYNYLDDVQVMHLPSCMPLFNVTSSNVEAHAVTLHWPAADAGATYTVYIDSTAVATGITTNSYTLTGLQADTDYVVGVQVNCSATDVSQISYVTISTLAEPLMCGSTTATIVSNAGLSTSNVTTNYFPGYSYYNYSYTEVIIPADRLGDLVEIKGMEFKPTNVAAGSNKFDNCEIYLMHTTATSLGCGFVQDTHNLQLVFTGNLSYTNTLWQQVAFDSSFVWNGIDNVLVAVRRNMGSYASSGQFDAYTSTDTLARYIYNDDSAYVVGDIDGGTATTTVPVYHLIGCPANNCGTTCQITIEGTDDYGDGWNDGYITVYQNGSIVDTCIMEDGSTYRKTISVCSNYPVEFGWQAGDYPEEASFTIYDGGGEAVLFFASAEDLPDSVFATLAAPCPSCLGVNVVVDNYSNNSATISWTDDNSGATYTIYSDSTVVASGLATNSYSFTGLSPRTEYHFGVQANCSATDASSIRYVTVVTTADPIMCGSDTATTVANVDSANNTTSYFPGNSYYDYSYTEVIIPASRLTGLGEIKGMEFLPTQLSSGSSYFSNCQIYMMHTSATSLAGGFIQDSTHFQLVYSGDLSHANTDWQQVDFNTSFFWNGTDNVVVAVHRNTGSYASSGQFAAYQGTDTLARYAYRDGTPFVIGNVPSGYATDKVPVYHLIGCESSGPAPMTLTVATDNSTMGTTLPAPGTYMYHVGDTMALAAVANPGYHFAYWQIGMGMLSDSLVMNPVILEVPAYMAGSNISATAYFAPEQYTVTALSSNPLLGSVSGGGTYNYGDTATLVATATPRTHFVSWSDGDTHAIRQIVVVGDTALTAHFALRPVTVTVVNDQPFKGTIVPYPGTYQYNVGDTITARATANYGYSFGSWGIDMGLIDTAVALNPATIVMPLALAGESVTITVNWTNNEYTLTVVSNDTALGTVTGSGIYPYGSSVTLEATPKPNCHFVSWSDGSTDAIHAVAVAGDSTYVATFAYDSVTIILSVNDAATGTITPAAGTYKYAVGETFTATATPNEGYEFLGWGCDGNSWTELIDNPVSRVLTPDLAGQTLSYKAYFQVRPEYAVYLSVRDSLGNSNTGGTVTGQGNYYAGDEVTITAIANEGYHFVSWTDETTGEVVSTEPIYTFVMPASHISYMAIFATDRVTGIDDADVDDIVIYSVNDRVIVRGAEGQSIRVFDVVGRLVAQRGKAGDEESIQLTNTGVYLVKVGDAPARRVVVRK